MPPLLVAASWAAWQYGPRIGELPTAGISALIPGGLEAERAERASDRIFGSSLLPRIVVVQRDPEGLSLADQASIVRHAVRLDRGELHGYPRGSIAVPYLNTLALFPAARERSTAAITYLAFPSKVEVTDQRDLAERYARGVSVPGAEAHVSGFVPGSLAESEAIRAHLLWVEIATPILIALIIGIYLRSLLAPIVTLLAAGLTFVLGTRAVAYLGLESGVPLQSEVQPIVDVLLLGVVTDYSVFFLAGARHRLLEGDRATGAARWAAAQYIPIIFTAAWLVALGLSTLRVASIDFVQALGPAMAVVVLVAMVVCVTFVPASIAILGRALYWPGLRPRQSSTGQRYRAWMAARLTKRWIAAPAIVLIVAALAAAGTGIDGARLALTPIQGLPSDAPAARGAEDASLGFAAGIVSPSEIVVRRPGIARDDAKLAALARLLDHVPGVAAVIGAGEAPIPAARRLFVAPARDAARFMLVLEHHPFGADAIDDLERVEAAMPRLLRETGLAGAHVAYAGDTAIAAGTVDRIRHDIMWVTLAAFAVNLVLLVLFLRSLVAPVLLIVASALALAATFGLTTYFFQGLLGYGELTYYVPLAVGVLLLSFGSDYNVFVVGRIWQESESQPTRRAIRTTAPRASRAISVAGLALACSFAALALVPLSGFYEFAFAMAVGVLIDTFVVRSYLIPALISLVGRRSWWPSSRGKPRLEPLRD